MARSKRRRETHRTTIVADGDVRRARVFLPAEALERDGTRPTHQRELSRWFRSVRTFPAIELTDAPADVSFVVDGFAFALFVGSDDHSFEVTGTHDGAAFVDAARDNRVEVFIAWGLDVRRASDDDLHAAATAGNLLGAAVSAYPVQLLTVDG